MKLLCRSILLILLVPALTLANNPDFKGRYTKEKTLKKEYSVNPGAGLVVDNSYGNVDITTWDQNRTVIEVVIRTNGNNEERVQERLDEITVEFDGNASRVSAKTRLGDSGNDSWKFWKRNNRKVSVEVNYTIRLPITNTVDISNDYGTIRLNRLEGNARLSCDYGQLIIGELLADDNMLKFDYTNNSQITFMKSGKINADYSGFTIDRADRIELSADYTRSEFGRVANLNYNCDYGKLTVGEVDELVGSGNYIPNNIGRVNGSVNLNTDYGSINIERLAPSTKSVLVNSDYTGIKIGYDAGLSFDFVVSLSYAGLNGEENLNITQKESGSSKKIFVGYHGSNGSGNEINIKSSYGGLTLKKL